MNNELLKVKGEVTLSLTNANGVKYFERTIPNLVVLVGREYIAARMKETGRPLEMSHMEIGQGSTTPVAGDTAIETPFVPQARVALAAAGGSVSSNTVTYSATFGPGVGEGAVTEAGIFNDSVAGTMLCRTVFPIVNKPTEDALSISWTVTILPE